MSRAIMVENMALNSKLNVNGYEYRTVDKALVGENYYSEKAPLPTFLTYLIYKPLVATEIIVPATQDDFTGTTIIVLGGLICSAIPFALLLTFAFYQILKKGRPQAIWIVILTFLSGFWWVYSFSFFSHILAAFYLISAYYALKNKFYFLGGTITSLLLLTEYSFAYLLVLWPIIAFIESKSLQNSLKIVLGALPGIVILLVYNYNTTGSAFTLLYSFVDAEEFAAQQQLFYGIGIPTWEALYGLTLSQFRGIFHYFPLLIFFLIYWLFKPKTITYSTLFNYHVPVIAIHFLLVASLGIWWGGWCYGPRHLIPVSLLATFVGLDFVSDYKFPKLPYFALGFWGMLVTYLVKNTSLVTLPDTETNPLFNVILKDTLNLNFNTYQLLSSFGSTQITMNVALEFIVLLGGTFIFQQWYLTTKHNQNL